MVRNISGWHLSSFISGIRVPELPVILENSDVNDLHLKQLPHDRSATFLISFIFLLIGEFNFSNKKMKKI